MVARNTHAMELRHLRYLVALAECLNFTRAAERMHVTQSTLSHQIKKLEDEIGFVLIDRGGKGLAMTEEGETFLEYAINALREVDRGVGALKKGVGAIDGELRIGATNTFNFGFIPRCVATFLDRHPEARVVVEELSADEIRRKVAAGELDLGIAYRPAEPSELVFEPLLNEEMVLALGHNHPLARRKRVRVVELHQQRLVLLPQSFATRVLLQECFLAAGAEPIVCVEMNSIHPMLELVAATRIGAIVAAHAVRGHPELSVVPIESPTPIRVPGILWRRDERQSPQARSFSAIVRKLARSRARVDGAR